MTCNGRRRSSRRLKLRRRAKFCLVGIVVYALLVTIVLISILVGSALEARAETKKDGQEHEVTKIRENYLKNNSEAMEQSQEAVWNLLLVNKEHPILEELKVELKEIGQGYQVDERIAKDLKEMLDDAENAGLLPRICSAYRTNEKQIILYNNKVKEFLDEGYTIEAAQQEAGKWVALPGTSEHETGLAVDIVSTDYQILDVKQEETPEQQWLMENSWKYGFILRYPNHKSNITGICYEPWHYRYVGKTAAKEMFERGVCLEEYLNMIAY